MARQSGSDCVRWLEYLRDATSQVKVDEYDSDYSRPEACVLCAGVLEGARFMGSRTYCKGLRLNRDECEQA